MNIKEYISSGIVESYVLGLSSAEERAEFEQLCAQYPELVAARTSFELLLEKQAFESANEPPAISKQKFADFLIQQESSKTESAKIVSMDNNTTSGTGGVRWLTAASVILLLVASWFAYKYYGEASSLKSQLENTKEEQAKLDSRLKALEDQNKVINDPKVNVVNLTGLQKAPTSSASVYWDSTSSNVWLLVKNLPNIPSDKQFQLWALIDGKPKDLGLFDSPAGDNKVMLKMNNTQKADAFAITIENRGNTGGPNLEQLQTMGKTKL
ncbi:MAG: anti-sigma factor [Chitinophagaceae bacterium]